MRQIGSNLLWIGNAMDARNSKQILDFGINAVVDLAYEELPAQLPRQLAYCRFPLIDGGGNNPKLVAQSLRTVVGMLQGEIPTLISCSAGMSRSPTIAAFAMAICFHKQPEQCISEIQSIKSLELNGNLWTQVQSAYQTLRLEMGE